LGCGQLFRAGIVCLCSFTPSHSIVPPLWVDDHLRDDGNTRRSRRANTTAADRYRSSRRYRLIPPRSSVKTSAHLPPRASRYRCAPARLLRRCAISSAAVRVIHSLLRRRIGGLKHGSRSLRRQQADLQPGPAAWPRAPRSTGSSVTARRAVDTEPGSAPPASRYFWTGAIPEASRIL